MPLESNGYNFCVLGAGIAGLSLADALQKRGYSVIVLEQHDIASGASGTPGGLVNPATGRRGKKSWHAETCYRAIRQNLQKVQAFSEAPFYQNNGLLRPALNQKMARKMLEQFDQTTWPADWCHWQTEKQIKERHPGINCVEGGLWLPIGLTVNVGAYLKAYAAFLRSKEVAIQTHCEADFVQINDDWNISLSDRAFKSEHLVFATGFQTANHPFWSGLPLEGVKGQVARFRADPKLLVFGHSVSGMGYIARLDSQTEFIQGSTYNHNFTDINPDKEGAVYLKSRLKKMLPKLAENAKLIEQWAGVRVNTPNRKPVLGRHPEIPNLHVFTALGSKGLMYGKFLAEHYVRHLSEGIDLFDDISIGRFYVDLD